MFRVISILLVTILLYSSAGFVLTFEHGISTTRKEVKEMLHNEEAGNLVTLKFHQSYPIHFKDEGKEIYLHGHMYDILKREEKNDSLLFLCFHDVEESTMLADFEEEMKELTNENDSTGERKNSSDLKQEYIQTELCLPIVEWLSLCTATITANTFLPTHSKAIPYPPPRFS